MITRDLVAAVRYLGGPDTSTDRPPTVHSQDARPDEILAERFARGDIDDEEPPSPRGTAAGTSERDHEPQPPADRTH